ncbi:MAG: hypothetical protein Q8Q09_02525, partial [Deltaproteobacteria bacterium]|nr:hypothetical protein [Deltaproteobacteria bacterium]
MQRRRLFEVSALFALTHCAASVTPERPLTDEERALTEAVLGYWYGLGGFVLVEGTQSPGADVLGQWWQLRFSRITERRLRMHWSGYLRDIVGSTPYDLLIVDGKIRADPDLQIRGFVADAPYEGHTFS